MDKLRSLHYFAAAARTQSLSAAARELGLSTAAVSKLITGLERELGVKLFERHAQGLTLTASGNAYLEACKPAMALLLDADEQARAASSANARGTVVLAVQSVVAQECLTPALPRFNALYPEIQLDVRGLLDVTPDSMRGVDVALQVGWPQHVGDWVQVNVGALGYVICAAPTYWASRGIPQHPRELEQHNCLTLRSNNGTLMDLWHFQKGEEKVSVAARGWLLADNLHRDLLRETTIAGGGVMRLLDWRRDPGGAIADGRLVPALMDWGMSEVPPVNLLYPPSVRRIPRVRLVIDWLTQLIRNIDQQRSLNTTASAPPVWLRKSSARASTILKR